MESAKKLAFKLVLSGVLLVGGYLVLPLLGLSSSIVAAVSVGISILVPQVVLEELDFYDRLPF